MDLAYCGLDCTTCDVHRATATGDQALQARCAQDWQGTATAHWGMAELRPEAMVCHGCKSETEPLFISCQRCPIRSCARGRNFATCAECSEWTSCPRLAGLLADVPAARENLARLASG